MKILLIVSDAVLRRALHMLLRAHGYAVKSYAAEFNFLADPAAMDSACLIVEHCPAYVDGIQLLGQLREAYWLCPAILITAENMTTIEVRARSIGYAYVVRKPFNHRMFLGLVDGVLISAEN